MAILLRYFYNMMTEELLDSSDINSTHHKMRSIGVPQNLEIRTFDSGCFDCFHVASSHLVFV